LSPNFMDSANVGVIQGGRGLRLSLKPRQRLRIVAYIIWKELESNKTVQSAVLGFVDHAHSAAAQLFDTAVVCEHTTDHLDAAAHADRADVSVLFMCVNEEESSVCCALAWLPSKQLPRFGG